jgi:nucleotide-binding universal stress UspA family protein
MPAPYTRIAVFVDQDPASRAALEEAISLREQSPGELHVVHVAGEETFLAEGYGYVPTAADIEAIETWLVDQARAAPGAVPVVLQGTPARVACEYATEAGVDLIVAAVHRGRVERAVLGSFAAYLAYHAPCPVLLARPALEAGDGRDGR